MKIVQLETFVVVAEELHFRRAAERLFMQPSSVSTQIAQLEAEYGTALFVRNSRNVTLSPAGEVLLEKAKAVLAGVEEMERTARSLAADDAPSLTVANFDEGLGALTSPVHANFALRYRNATVVATAPDYASLATGLLRGASDVAILDVAASWFQDLADVWIVELWNEPTVLALPVGHPLAMRPHVAIEDLFGEPFLEFDGVPPGVHDVFMLRKVRGDDGVNVRTEASHMHNILNLVAQSVGILTVTTSVPQFYQRPDVVYVPIADGLRVAKAAVVRRGESRPHVLGYVEECVRAVRSSLGLIPAEVDVTGGVDVSVLAAGSGGLG